MDELRNFVYPSLKLYSTDTDFFVVPEKENTVLKIEKQTGTLSMVSSQIVPFTTLDLEPRDVVALIGITEMVACPYLMIATESELVGYVDGDKPVYRIPNTDLIPFAKSFSHLTQTQLSDIGKYLDMIKFMLSCPELYYSSSFDLTHTMQRLQGTGPQFLSASLISRADMR